MALALLALGSNLGPRRSTLENAVALIDARPQIRVLRHSDWLETAPIGGPVAQKPFLNGALLAETSLNPEQLLAVLFAVETQLGRTRHERWSARTIDLDLLLCNDLIRDGAELRLPHPRMAFRYFMLQPAAEVASEMIHPEIGWSIGHLLQHLRESDNYIAFAGPPTASKRELLETIARQADVRLVFGPKTPAGIELQREQADLLRQDRFAAHSNQTMLSDFWLAPSVASSDTGILALTPRLIVFLDDALASDEMRGHGPTLRLDSEKPESWEVEILAAINAMQVPNETPLSVGG